MPLLPETHLHKIIAGILDEYEPVDGRLGTVDVIEIAMRVGRLVAEYCRDLCDKQRVRHDAPRNIGAIGSAKAIAEAFGLDEPCDVCDVCGFSGGDGNLGHDSLPCPKCVGKEGE